MALPEPPLCFPPPLSENRENSRTPIITGKKFTFTPPFRFFFVVNILYASI